MHELVDAYSYVVAAIANSGCFFYYATTVKLLNCGIPFSPIFEKILPKQSRFALHCVDLCTVCQTAAHVCSPGLQTVCDLLI